MVTKAIPADLREALQTAWNYPLFDAIFNRRSRRFAVGSEIPGGVHRYKSQQPPLPLDEMEEALLAESATGISGLILADLPFLDDRDRDAGGNTICHWTGRTWPSPCASHDTHLVYWNDEATYLIKEPDLSDIRLREYADESDRDKVLRRFRAGRVKLFDGRPQYPRNYPTMLPFNIWSSDIPGSTMFLPVIDVTFEFINVLFLMTAWPDGGFYIIDDLNGNVPAGCERWAQEGLLNRMFALPLSYLGTISRIEAGFLIQNLLLAEQAMGLGGWAHAHPAAMVLLGGTPLAKGLGFRFITPRPARAADGAGLTAGLPSPVGLDGLLEPYCPPYYRDMDAAVDAIVEGKFGTGGAYTRESGQPLPFLAKNEFVESVPRYSDKVVRCVKDICNYIYDTYGRFPHLDAIQTAGCWVQAHHLDLDFYDRFYPDGAYTESQRDHMKVWHAEVKAKPAAAAAGVS
ncbi:MAG: hypothetical protein HYS09_09735 [Chloroflexi bacterium]|nr:hypothetical protein [Chloroflexota bacterium]